MNFDNESMLTIDKRDINVLILIELHYNTLMALQEFRKEELQNMTPVSKPVLFSRVEGLYYMLRPSLKSFDKSLHTKIKNLATSKLLNDKLNGFEEIQDFLFSKGVLRYGRIKNIDTTNTFEEDESKGL